MIRLRQNRSLIVLTILLGAIVLGASWCWHGCRRMARAAASALTQKRRECRRLAALNPPPTAVQAAVIEADLAQAESLLAALREEFWSATPAVFRQEAADAPTSRTDAFFDLTAFVKRMREGAERAGVGLRAEEQFGFAAYAHEGPVPALIPAIRRQRQAAASLLEILFTAHPAQLLAVQRARSRGIPADTSLARQAGGAALVGEADGFEFDPRLSLRDGEVEEVAAFQLTFTGYTVTLRRFLNQLTAADPGVVVRNVAVEPEAPNRMARPAAQGGPDPLVPAVKPTMSRFVVTVESCKPVGLPPPAHGPASDRSGSNGVARRWLEPTAQRRGLGWIYDLFTPPAVQFDPRSRALTAIPSLGLETENAGAVPFDLELLEVHREPFRLQLVGYVGKPEELRGIFLDLRTGETVISRAGDRLAGTAFSLKRLGVLLAEAAAGDAAMTGDPAAVATVTDETTGDEITLTNGAWSWSGAPFGVFASRRTPGSCRKIKEGESVALNGASYCVKHIEVDPPLAVITDVTPSGAVGAIHTLTPRPAVAAAAASPVKAAERTARSFSSTP